ncbi:hypothetical protein AVEN_84202-1 [Araneus ventricosus]|uniref:Uncharacterized protein n=1 Tax=Araneus ventricosus TaxID=182803 RepID=A0A4Y2VQT5_ARAVE|nr:hypothetical protein AVEN_84202-1 [Araneus ventricosus]
MIKPPAKDVVWNVKKEFWCRATETWWLNREFEIRLHHVSTNNIGSSPFLCALREGYSRVWGGGLNDHPDWESPIHVEPSQKAPVLKGIGE